MRVRPWRLPCARRSKRRREQAQQDAQLTDNPRRTRSLVSKRPAQVHVTPAVCAGNGEAPINNSLTEGALSLIMKHPNIVRSLGYEAIPNRSPDGGGTHEIRLLMEFCDRGSLDKAVTAGCFHEVSGGVFRVRGPFK